MPEFPETEDSSSVLPVEYYAALGRVAAAWAELELEMNLTIWELANIQQRLGACLTSQMIGPGPRIRALAALVEQRGASKEVLSELNKLSRDIDSAAGQRNRLVHDPHLLKEQSGTLHRLQITADRKLQFQFVSSEIEDIRAVEAKIVAVTGQYRAWASRMLRALPTFSRREFRRPPGIQLNPVD